MVLKPGLARIVPPVQSMFGAENVQVNAPTPGAASTALKKVVPAGMMSRTMTLKASASPPLVTLRW